MNFIAELKRRNVIRMAGLYLVGAWLITQVAGTILPMFGAPDWIARSIVIILAIGFIPALIVAWIFELTPDGLKRDSEIPEAQSIAPQTAQKMNRLLLLVSMLAIGYFVFDKFVLAPKREKALVAQTTQQISAKAALAQSKENSKSIAVLAFTNMSADKDNEFFSDGISEEILNSLAQVKDLKVAGRTSSFYFKGRNENLQSIGKTLGVAHVLEGSVRKQGDKVRITAQLIQVKDGYHLWSETYDGDMKDVFALQERIARSITDQLKIVLVGKQAEQLVNAGTENPEAYAFYLQASVIFNRRDREHYADAVAALKNAIALDPGYARAYSRMAAIYVVMSNAPGMNQSNLKSQVEYYAKQASALDPSLAEPYAALGTFGTRFAKQLVTSRRYFEHALELNENDVTTNFWFGLALLKTGYRQRGIVLIDRALELDPMLPNALRWRGILYFANGNILKAEQLLQRSRDAGLVFADLNLADIAYQRGDVDEAVLLYTSGAGGLSPGLSTDDLKSIAQGLYKDATARAKAVAFINDYLARPHEYIGGLLPLNLFNLQEPAKALSAAGRFQTSDNTDFMATLWSPQGKAMRELPEFQPFLRDFGFIDLWNQYGAPDLCKKKTKGDYVCE